jgi:hypothetical protein
LRQVNPNKASGPDTYALGFYWWQMLMKQVCSSLEGVCPLLWICLIYLHPSSLLEDHPYRGTAKHLEKNKILTNLNHGFRSGYSCETQLLTKINDFLQEHDKGHQIDVAILDF